MIQISGKKITVSHDLSKPTIKTSLFLDYNKATSEIGWSPRTDLNSGIEKTLKWFKENINV
jgi:nucleoside-diphosphate-sugar epimerase